MKKIKLVTKEQLLKWQGGLKDEDAAEKLGISRSHYNKLKTGNKAISEQFSIRFALMSGQ